MKKILIFENLNDLNSKKEALTFLNIVKKYTKQSSETIILPHILFLLFLKEKYSGKKIKFACLADTFSQKIISTLNSFSIRYFLLNDYVSYSKLPESILQKNNIILNLPNFENHKDGVRFDDMRQEIINIYNTFKKRGKLKFNKMFLVYSNSQKINNKNLDSLERDILFIKKTVYDVFYSDAKKVKILYSISYESIEGFWGLEFLDGLFVSK